MAAWQIRAGGNAEMADAFLTEKRVCLGYAVSVSLTQFRSESELQKWMQANAMGEGPDSPRLLWQLIGSVQIGDLVVTPTKPSRREYAIGRITGGYEFAPELLGPNGVPHTRAVEWLKTGIPGERMAPLRLPPRGTIARLRSHDIEARIEAILD